MWKFWSFPLFGYFYSGKPVETLEMPFSLKSIWNEGKESLQVIGKMLLSLLKGG